MDFNYLGNIWIYIRGFLLGIIRVVVLIFLVINDSGVYFFYDGLYYDGIVVILRIYLFFIKLKLVFFIRCY